MEAEQAEESLDGGDVEEEYVVRALRLDGLREIAGFRGTSFRRGSQRLLLEDASDGSLGESPTGSGEDAGDPPLAAEADEGHGLNERAHDVGVSADGWRGPNEFPRPVVAIVGTRDIDVLFPPENGVRGDPEPAGGLRSRKAEEAPDAKNPVALRRTIMGTSPFG
jgi:hypothetical protein